MDNHDIVYTNNETRIKETFIMNNKDKIGSGAFGEVYRGYHAKTKVKLAFKMELSTTTTPQLPIEYKVLKLMQGYRK
jgi:serine/threonine protein kinase